MILPLIHWLIGKVRTHNVEEKHLFHCELLLLNCKVEVLQCVKAQLSAMI